MKNDNYTIKVWTIEELCKNINEEKIILSTKIQRTKQIKPCTQNKMIHCLLAGNNIPSIQLILRNDENNNDVYHSVDGNQRMLAIVDFYNGKTKLSHLNDDEDFSTSYPDVATIAGDINHLRSVQNQKFKIRLSSEEIECYLQGFKQRHIVVFIMNPKEEFGTEEEYLNNKKYVSDQKGQLTFDERIDVMEIGQFTDFNTGFTKMTPGDLLKAKYCRLPLCQDILNLVKKVSETNDLYFDSKYDIKEGKKVDDGNKIFNIMLEDLAISRMFENGSGEVILSTDTRWYNHSHFSSGNQAVVKFINRYKEKKNQNYGPRIIKRLKETYEYVNIAANQIDCALGIPLDKLIERDKKTGAIKKRRTLAYTNLDDENNYSDFDNLNTTPNNGIHQAMVTCFMSHIENGEYFQPLNLNRFTEEFIKLRKDKNFRETTAKSSKDFKMYFKRVMMIENLVIKTHLYGPTEPRCFSDNDKQTAIQNSTDELGYVHSYLSGIVVSNPEADHIIPYSKGGTSDISNLGITERCENRHKSNS